MLLPGALWAQQGDSYDIQANIIYRFTKYIDWPEDKKTGDFIIGIVGDSPIKQALDNFIGNKTAGSRRIITRRFSSVASVFNCHILFISEDERSSLRKIAWRTNGSPVLIVTEAEGMARIGACINFSIVAERLTLEINKNTIEERNMNIASELLQLGKIVR
ncbi:MAG TPA: YfiR family protein [Chitinophagaceae bacterium]|nr:YfiR family protein [Chitinophagaceae bacterium]